MRTPGRWQIAAMFTFNDQEGPLFTVSDLRYDFTGGAAPVPEPGTLILCGAGLAAVAARCRKKKDATRPADR